MNKLTRSWNIFKKSMIVINREKKLLIFPLFSCIAMIMLILLILTGVVTLVVLSPDTVPEATTTASTTTAADSENVSLVAKLIELAVYFVLYLITMLISNFCSTAFFYEIFRAFNGDQASISRGFRYALSRFKAIFLWSLVASTIGVILRALQERAGLLGQIALKLVGVVWAVASCFVIPALVIGEPLPKTCEYLCRFVLCNPGACHGSESQQSLPSTKTFRKHHCADLGRITDWLRRNQRCFHSCIPHNACN